MDLGFSGLGDFLTFFFADRLKPSQVGWGPLVDSHVQVSPEMFDKVQVRALAGPLQNIHRVVPKPLLCCLGCVLRVIVMLEGEPWALSEVLSAVEQIFIEDLSVL